MITKEKSTSKKEARIAVRLSENHKARIEQAAAMTGQTVNSFVASEMVKRADEIMDGEEIRRLTNRDRDIFWPCWMLTPCQLRRPVWPPYPA